MDWSSLFSQAPAPDWFRWAMIVLGSFGVATSTLFVAGFLTAPTAFRRFSLEAVDQWLLYALGATASGLYLSRWVHDPPITWGGPGFGAVSILLLSLVNAAFVLRLIVWRRLRRGPK